MIKHEWRKHEKDIYVPKARPELIKVLKIYCDRRKRKSK
ncbi:hypothetical protein J2Z43_002500 [Clostridioides mangenotii]|uniref:Uncharacterized protein n=1 Tax=Metaclostridioides mangenotii TaxID=1540 RepID=A0ABS4EDT3_9FIRM|nr:hypothetical protein [Clostridioides mangenotii]